MGFEIHGRDTTAAPASWGQIVAALIEIESDGERSVLSLALSYLSAGAPSMVNDRVARTAFDSAFARNNIDATEYGE